ncbi:MAG: hypothetical protein HKN26_01645 [Acidimicrobiales bacterium]|nr:hypothetical protein [Acidimicrobiales bacterium]
MPRPDRMPRNRLTALALIGALALLVASCSGTDIELTEPAESVVTDPEGSTSPPSTASPESAPSSSDASSVRDGRLTRVQAVYLAEDGAWEIDGQDRRLLGPVSGEIPQAYWVGDDRDVVLVTTGEVQAHTASGAVRTTACPACQGIAELDGRYYTMTGDRELLALDRDTLDATVVPDEIPPPAVDFAAFGSVVAATGTEVVVLVADPVGPSAYGGPQEIWAVTPDSGASRLIAALPYNAPIHGWQASPDGSELVFVGAGQRGGTCSHHEVVTTLDLSTGVLTELPALVDAEQLVGHELRTFDAFWNGDSVFAIFELFWSSDAESICDVAMPPALYRFDDLGQRWERVDAGPLNQVRPLGPAAGQKLVNLRDSDVFYEAGDGGAELLSTSSFIAGSTPPDIEVGLAPPGRAVSPPTLEVLPSGALVGVALETDADVATDRLLRAFGPVDLDTGWTAGCPLDGNTFADEKLLRWGVVAAVFTRTSEDDPGRLSHWFISANATGSVGPGQVHLPGSVELGDRLAEAEAAYGVESFDIGFLYLLDAGGFTLAAETADDPITDVGVPFLPICD